MEILQRRKFCREFLNGYNEKLHPQIISKVFEIGLLILKRKYKKLLFSKEELDDIIKALSGKNYVEIIPLPPLHKFENLSPQKFNSQQKENYYFNTDNNNDDFFNTKIIRQNKLNDNYLKSPNFATQNSAIYPNWWWNNKEENEIENKKNNINIIYNEENDDFNNMTYNNGIYKDNNNFEYINIDEGNGDEINYQNYPERKDIENNEIRNKNYTIKKLTMNSGKKKKNNKKRNNEEYLYYEKQGNFQYIPKSLKKYKINKRNPFNINAQGEAIQRVKSSKFHCRKNCNNLTNINNNSHIINSINKRIKMHQNINQKKKNLKLGKVPKFRYTYINGRILRIPE